MKKIDVTEIQVGDILIWAENTKLFVTRIIDTVVYCSRYQSLDMRFPNESECMWFNKEIREIQDILLVSRGNMRLDAITELCVLLGIDT